MLALFAADTARNPFTDPDTLLLVAGLIIPFVTAVLTKWRSPDWVKGAVSITLAAAVTVVRKAPLEGTFDWGVFLNGFVQTWLAALISWLGLTSDWTAKLNQITGRVGIGPVAPVDVEPMKPTPPPDVAIQGE